jgi:hypothetical protein
VYFVDTHLRITYNFVMTFLMYFFLLIHKPDVLGTPDQFVRNVTSLTVYINVPVLSLGN